MSKKKKKSTAKKQIKKGTVSSKPISTDQEINLIREDFPKWLGWALAIFAFLLYANTLGHGYAFDDSIVITENSFTQQGFGGIYDLMTKDFFIGIYGEQGMELTGGRYRPLSLVMFAVEYQFFGLNPFVGHFINVLLYALTAFLLFKVLRNWLSKIEGGAIIALIASLLFIAHPIHTEVVANIKSRDEILSFLLVLVTLQALYKLVTNKENSTPWLILSLGAFFLSLLAKETAFVFVALIPLGLYVFQQQSWSDVIKYSIPFWGVAFAYLGLRHYMVGGLGGGVENTSILENPFYQVATGQKLGTIGLILLYYLQLLFAPVSLSSDYSREQIPLVELTDPLALLGWGIYIAIGAYAAFRIWKRDILAWSILLYLAPLSLVCNLLFNIGAPMGERFLYFSSLGFALAIAYGMVRYVEIPTWQKMKQNFAAIGGLGLVLVLFSAKTIDRNPDWKNNETLFAQDVQTSANSAKMQYYYGNTLLTKYLGQEENAKNKQLLETAEKHFMKSYEINKNFIHATYNLGLLNIQKRNAQEALKWLKYTLELEPNYGKAHEQLVRTYGEFLNQPQKAMEHLNFVLSTPIGQTSNNYQSLGILNAMQKNYPAAEKAFLKSIELDPNVAQNYQNLGGLYLQMGNQAKGQQYMEKAYQLKPSLRPK